MAKFIVYDTLAEAQAAQLAFDIKLGYRDENGDALHSTLHAFDIIKAEDFDKWYIPLETVAGMAAASIEFKGKQLPLEAVSGTAVIRAVVGQDAVIKTESQMRNAGYLVKYEQGEPVEGTY